ncbi:methylated-DNA--[protein]-cysteine S-methyltransferase [Pseudomaricurvus alkylphenolicus]|uniref:methylated-DNA--[protein]-cysteine S-methyltransferase n=1 Tax=Pseudomaricurvus alkylphenolicus TaxID=1306991 RepID=UPI0030B86AB8
MYYDTFDSPVGEIIVVANDEGICNIDFQDSPCPLPIDPSWQQNPEPCAEAKRQLLAYFAGELKQFQLPLSPQGTDFQKSVWKILASIPYGQHTSYGAMAKQLGNPGASRAVGMANGRNPISIVLPCHRVIGSNGKLTGYRGGLPIKTKLLKLEGIKL